MAHKKHFFWGFCYLCSFLRLVRFLAGAFEFLHLLPPVPVFLKIGLGADGERASLDSSDITPILIDLPSCADQLLHGPT